MYHKLTRGREVHPGPSTHPLDAVIRARHHSYTLTLVCARFLMTGKKKRLLD